MSEPVPAAAWAQIKICAATPQQISVGVISMDLDPSFFGDISNVAVFSATGDAAGYAHVSGNHVDAHFSSGSGSIGQLPGLPLFVISVPLLPGLAQNATAALTLDTANSSFTDVLGRSYSVAVAPATAQTGGNMSVQSVSPGGGVVPGGGVIQISGAGFDSSTAVGIDGVSIASTQLVSSQEIDITLGGAAEMTGKRLRLTNAAGDRIDFFVVMPSAPAGGAATQPLLPLNTYQLVQWTYPIEHPEISQYFALQNQTAAPVAATFFGADLCPLGTYTIPPGTLHLADYNSARLAGGSCAGGNGVYGSAAAVYMIASAPIRMLAYQYTPQTCLTCTVTEATFPPIAMAGFPFPYGLFTASGPFTWNYQIGQSPPSPIGNGLNYSVPISLSVSPSAAPWLTAALVQDTATGIPALVLTPNVASLAPGTYTGSFTMTIATPLPPYLSQYPAPSSTYQVVLNVSASPLITFGPLAPGASIPWWAFPDPGYAGPYPTTVPLQSTSDPTPFTVTVTNGTDANWLLVTPLKGTTPASLTVDVNPAGLGLGQYSGQVMIQGPANSTGFPAAFTIFPPPALSFVLEPGASSPANAPQVLYFSGTLGTLSTLSIQAQSGGNWLAATLVPQESEVWASASAAGLDPGTYQATITVNGSTSSIQIPVTLTVLAPPANGLTATPSSLSLTAAAGQTATQSFAVNSPDGAAIFGLNAQIYPVPALGAGTNLQASLTVTATSVAVQSTPSVGITSGPTEYNPSPAPVAPATYQVQASAAQPGTYYGSIVVTWNGGSLTVPVTLSVTATTAFPPILGDVVNAASQMPTALAPGEIVSVFGMGIGAAPSLFTLDAKGNLPTSINGTQVLINGTPAPLLYTSASQINAIVPYEIGNSGTATIQVVSNGLPSDSWGMPVMPAAPAIFTTGGGVGQAAALNQDGSLNGPSNPASRGTVITLFAPGCGQTMPAGAMGTIAPNSPGQTVVPVTVTVGGVNAPVAYHGSAPGEITGLIQVNAVVPPGVAPGPAVAVVLSVGGAQSPGGVTIAVQ